MIRPENVSNVFSKQLKIKEIHINKCHYFFPILESVWQNDVAVQSRRCCARTFDCEVILINVSVCNSKGGISRFTYLRSYKNGAPPQSSGG